LGRAVRRAAQGVLWVWTLMCMGDPEVCVHKCTPTHRIGVHGAACKGEKGMHYVHACWLHNCACVRDCVLDMHALMRARVRDRGI
jgi:hypothetical protein